MSLSISTDFLFDLFRDTKDLSSLCGADEHRMPIVPKGWGVEQIHAEVTG
jgi:hypothetical protein